MGYINSVLSNPAFQVFLIAMIGYIIGRIKIKGIEVGDAGILITDCRTLWSNLSVICKEHRYRIVCSIGWFDCWTKVFS